MDLCTFSEKSNALFIQNAISWFVVIYRYTVKPVLRRPLNIGAKWRVLSSQVNVNVKVN